MKMNKKAISSVGEVMGKPDPVRAVGGNVKWCSPNGKRSGVFSQSAAQNCRPVQQFRVWACAPQGPGRGDSKMYLHAHAHGGAIHESQKVEATEVTTDG